MIGVELRLHTEPLLGFIYKISQGCPVQLCLLSMKQVSSLTCQGKRAKEQSMFAHLLLGYRGRLPFPLLASESCRVAEMTDRGWLPPVLWFISFFIKLCCRMLCLLLMFEHISLDLYPWLLQFLYEASETAARWVCHEMYLVSSCTWNYSKRHFRKGFGGELGKLPYTDMKYPKDKQTEGWWPASEQMLWVCTELTSSLHKQHFYDPW